MSIDKSSVNESADESEDLNSEAEETAQLDTNEADSEADEAEESEDKEPTEGDESESKDEDKKPRNKWKKRIDGLKGRISATEAARAKAEQELAHWREQALKGQTSQKPEDSKTPIKSESGEGEPDPDDFDSVRDYNKAVVRYELAQIKKAEHAEQEQQAQAKQVQTFAERYKSFAEKTEDFLEVIEDVSDVKGSEHIEKAIIKSEFGPELMYELAQDRAELERIIALPADVQLYLISQMESRFRNQGSESVAPKKEIRQSKAPAPITPVGGKPSPAKRSVYEENLSFAEYEKIRKAKK